MFINESIVAIIFRLFNFSLVIALATYAFKKYVLPNVLVTMVRKESEKEFLLNQQELLEQKQRELDELIKHDTHYGEYLKLKINEWSRVIAEKHSLQEHECLLRLAVLDKRQNQKNARQKEIMMQELVQKDVACLLKKSLVDHFESEKAGKKYVEDIVSFMQEGRL